MMQPMMMQAPAAPQKRSSVFWGVLLALIVFFVVIPIFGVISCVFCGGIGAGLAASKADIGTANTECNSIRSATILYQNSHPNVSCATVEQLKADNLLEATFKNTDPWGNAFKIQCKNDDIICSTPGRDRTWGTSDDIVVPPPEVR